MKYLLVLALSLCYLTGFAADTSHVVTHHQQLIVTNPSTGNKSYKRWGVFPSKNTPVRKIILHLQFGCPDSLRCADWDYLDFITIRRVGGVNGESKDYQIARMLTPYGGAFFSDWKFNWEVDATDFSLLLRDSVEIEYNHSGFEPSHDRGWKITLDFEIIKGKPVAEPLSIQKIYSGFYRYGDSKHSIEEQLVPVAFNKMTGAGFAKFMVMQTGHGANGGDNCGEFCSKNRMIYLNDQLIDKRPIWKKCGDNPLYPQAGTWLYNRAAWCPGYLQTPDVFSFPLQQQQNSINIDMEPYVATGTSQADENICAYIIQYKKNPTANDVSILDIEAPTDKQSFSRKNPEVFNPVVVVKNNGTKELKSLMITYGTKGFANKQYQWKGNIRSGEQARIELPGSIDAQPGVNYFTVKLIQPNGKADEFEEDNSMAARFTKAPVHNGQFVIVINTNQQPTDNSYTLTNRANNKILYQRSFDSTQANKLFKDTVQLEPGFYTFMLKDSSGNGLEFWADSKAGNGYARLEDTAGNLIKNFLSDFGSSIQYNFTVSANQNEISAYNTEAAISLYPTRSKGKTVLEYYSGKSEDVTVQIITDEGAKLVEEHLYKNLKSGSFSYDMSYLPAQRYYVKVWIKGKQVFNKRLRIVN